MIYRTADIADIPGMQAVRLAVQENRLSDPGLITYDDYKSFLTMRGKGWVCESDGVITGFAVVDMQEQNVWALFVSPQWEGKGIGQRLHAIMLEWYFGETRDGLWLSTAPGTRAERFYRRAGWCEAGMYGREVRFEMEYDAFLLSSTHA